ncbi:hypothetical protein [Desulfosporosinus youngiae]|uniref:Uncharacterized protein n=1 Tax=Desulfosporosinus youngiae DSM 17734 TaxID=768710 RepID=H5XU29_9FIRM|nr:hypothetical protein [Desulfosporosinus youngiae]EHQ88987.1 hypothetical protein DesyoDRAFT_1865 [Desulfosporosinus youngiae DSM 17734]
MLRYLLNPKHPTPINRKQTGCPAVNRKAVRPTNTRISEDTLKKQLCTTLNMTEWDEEAIKSSIERILIRHDGDLEIEYKHEMRYSLEY